MLIRVGVVVAVIAGFVQPCERTEFRCTSGECISSNRHCNGLAECFDGSDEYPNCSPCNRTYFGEIGRTYELEVKRPTDAQIPFLCFLNFTSGGGPFGELVQLTFESFAVGTFESFTNEGCPDGFVSIKEGNRPDMGGKWCGSAWGYTVYYSETSNVNLTLQLERHPQQQSSGYTFEFKLSYKYLRHADAKIRYGNSTLRSHRGKLTAATYCDRLLDNCSRRPCRLQSPNYPGIYPRNLTCRYRVRERAVPPGKHALLALRPANFHPHQPLDRAPNFDNSDRVLRIWDQCSLMQDYVEIRDGWGEGSATLAHLCSGETIPEIISSGPELLVMFHTSPFGNPFHPLPLSFLPGFELEVEVFYVNKESPSYIAPGKKCEFIVTNIENSSGLLESPLHSLPPNTTCHYHFQGHPKEIVWISFIKYHVTNERLNEIGADCDVQLQIWDGNLVNNSKTIPLIGQFCKDDKPKLCDHTLLKNSSRLTRPCNLPESYVSTSSDLTISHSMRYGSVFYPVSFVLHYEFVDLAQEGVQFNQNPCSRLFRETNGRFASPKITFLYGRGGQSELSCAYHFESTSEQNQLRITILKAGFGSKQCQSFYNPEISRWVCSSRQLGGVALVKVVEYPWSGVEVLRDCFCSNLTEPITITTQTARKVVVKFEITKMRITDDYRDFFFEANYEFVSPQTDCLNPWKSRRLRGSSGEITVRNNAASVKQNEQHYNQTLTYCLHQPWLIEPEDSLNNFIYLKVRGLNKRDSRLCPSKNRVLVYSAERSEEVKVICPAFESGEDVVEMFSDGWNSLPYRRIQGRNSRSFIVEFLQRETGSFVVNWMEVSKNPALTLPSTMLMINPPNCPHSCPELNACISSDLWCDGLRHCPSGNDEQESNCSISPTFSISLLNSIALSAIVLTLLLLVVIASFYCCRRRDQQNVIVSVTEHTFLEFKTGLC